MKATSRFFLILCFSLFACTGQAAALNLIDALNKKLIRLELKGAGSHNNYLSSHYGKCISMKLKNLSAKNLVLNLDAGYVLMASDTTTQDMLLTEDIFVKLEPGKEKRLFIYAMCSEKNNGAPSENISYRIGTVGKGHLKELAQLIYKRKIQNSTGQSAVWCLSDGQHISGINGSDTADVRILREFVSKVTGQRMDGKVEKKLIRRQTIRTEYKLSGMFDFTIHEARSVVTIRLKDSQGNVIRTWVDQATFYKGHHVQSYELSGNSLAAGDYFIELIIDNVSTMNRKLSIPD